MLCRVCGISVKSNNEIKLHLESDHGVTLNDYYRCNPHATKYCNKCKRELPVTEFYIDRHNTSGYRTRCIRCIHPEGYKSECPLCHRVLHESAIVRHLKEGHGIAPRRAHREFIKRKRCPKCKTIKPLRDFYRKRDGGYHCYCKRCSLDRVKTLRLLQCSWDHSEDVTGTVANIRQGHTTSYSTGLEIQENDTLRTGPDGSAK